MYQLNGIHLANEYTTFGNNYYNYIWGPLTKKNALSIAAFFIKKVLIIYQR